MWPRHSSRLSTLLLQSEESPGSRAEQHAALPPGRHSGGGTVWCRCQRAMQCRRQSLLLQEAWGRMEAPGGDPGTNLQGVLQPSRYATATALPELGLTALSHCHGPASAAGQAAGNSSSRVGSPTAEASVQQQCDTQSASPHQLHTANLNTAAHSAHPTPVLSHHNPTPNSCAVLHNRPEALGACVPALQL